MQRLLDVLVVTTQNNTGAEFIEKRFREHAERMEKQFAQQGERLYQVVLCATLVVALALSSNRARGTPSGP